MCYINEKASSLFFSATQITFELGLLSFDEYSQRLVLLEDLLEEKSPLKEGLKSLLLSVKKDSDDKLHYDQLNNNSCDIRDRIFRYAIRYRRINNVFCFVSPLPNLRDWVFHQADDDYFPSIPHGHYLGKKQPKLDPYLGWIYDGSTQKNRLSRKDIIQLWNDKKFRDFAKKEIEWYIETYPSHHWKIPNPRRLPRTRSTR